MLNLDYRLIYPLGSTLLFIPYFLIAFSRKDLRKYILPISLIPVFFEVAAEYLFFKDYWFPPAYFELNLLGLRIIPGDILLGLVMPTIMAFAIPFLLKLDLIESRKTIKEFSISLLINHVIVTSSWFLLSTLFNVNSILSVIIGTTIYSAYVLYKRQDLRKIYISTLLVCGISTFFFYYLFQAIVSQNYLESVWLLDHAKYSFSIGNVHIPITEILFAAFVGPFYGILLPFLGHFKYEPSKTESFFNRIASWIITN